MKSAITILLIDDQPLYRQTLAPALERLAPSVNILEATCMAEAMMWVDKEPNLDMILYDWFLPDGGKLKSLIVLSQLLPSVPIVVTAAADNANIITGALSAGARGYLSKTADAGVVQGALTLVLSGETYVPSIALGTFFRSDTPRSALVSLTARQEDVLRLLAKGYSNKQISQTLGIADTTVRVHVSDILRHLQARNRTDAVLKARQLDLLDQLSD